MNEFYSIGAENKALENPFQLRNLGNRIVIASLGMRKSSGWGDRDNSYSQKYYRKTTEDDYNNELVYKIISTKPPYEIDNLMNYHLDFYINQKNGSQEKFLKQIEYVVLPIVEKRKGKEVYLKLLIKWIEENKNDMKEENKDFDKIHIGNINAPTQIQINSRDSKQTQNITYTKENILELFELLKADIENLNNDLKEELINEIDKAVKYLDKDKDISSRLLIIGGLIKDIGINVFASLIASPLYGLLKMQLGLI